MPVREMESELFTAEQYRQEANARSPRRHGNARRMGAPGECSRSRINMTSWQGSSRHCAFRRSCYIQTDGVDGPRSGISVPG